MNIETNESLPKKGFVQYYYYDNEAVLEYHVYYKFLMMISDISNRKISLKTHVYLYRK